MSLENRLRKLENELIGEKGIPAWAVDVANKEAVGELYNFENFGAIRKKMEKLDGIKRPKMDLPKLQTPERVERYALELSEKYTSLEDYTSNLTPISFDAVMKRIREDRHDRN